MEIEASHDLPLPIATVWQAINDPAILQASIPGCQELTQISPTELSAVVRLKIGPLAATFKGDITLSELNPPFGCVISGKGSGGVAGAATGSARVMLEAIETVGADGAIGEGADGVGSTGDASDGVESVGEGSAEEGTRLSYSVDVAVTGKIAQLGSRLIESTAKKLSAAFFTNFINAVSPDDGADGASAETGAGA